MVGRAFFAATFLVATAVFVGALAVFAFVPRLGAGFVLGARAQPNLIGLGDEVALGRYGTAGTARHAVVLRATLPRLRALATDDARRDAAERLYFRGAVYDAYDRGRWIRSRRPELRTVLDQVGGRAFIHELGEAPVGDTVAGADRQEIEAVGVPAAVLFAADRPVAIELPSTRLGAGGPIGVVPRWSGEAALRVGGGDAGDGFVTLAHAHYVAYSRPLALGAGVLDPHARLDDLALPEGLAGMKDLGARLGAGRDDPGKIAAVIAWLRSGHSYTTKPPPRPAGVDPVDDFLFSQPVGHCEFFASAAVLLLRAADVPARYVTGFRGGDWNPIGGYVAVRGERAHAWAEAFVTGVGWTRVDATPPADALAPAGRFADTSDALDFFWSRWVVGYDLGRQRDLARQAWHELGHLGPRAPLGRLLMALVLGAALIGLGLAARTVPPAARALSPRFRDGGQAGGPCAANRRCGRSAVPPDAGPAGAARMAPAPERDAARIRHPTPDGRTVRARRHLRQTYQPLRRRPLRRQEAADEAVAALGRTIGDVLASSPQN